MDIGIQGADIRPAGSADSTRPHSAVAGEVARGERGGSATGAAHAGPQRHKQRYDGIWGALVSLQMEGNHQSGRVLVEKTMFWRFSQH